MGGAAVRPVRHGARAARVSSLFSLCCSFPPGSFRASAPPQAQSLVVFIALAASCAIRGEWRWCAGMLALAVAFHPAALWIVPVFWVFTAVRRNTWFFAAASRRMVYRRSGPGAAARPPRQRVSAVLPGARNAHGAAAFRRSAGHFLSRSIRSSHRPALRSTSFSRCCSYGA